MVPAMVQSGLPVSLCTITESPELFGLSGAPTTAAYTPLAGHVDIQCILAGALAVSGFGGQGEDKKPDRILTRDQAPVTLMGYYPAITTNHRALIDGIEWDIVSSAPDSQAQMTCLVVQRASQ